MKKTLLLLLAFCMFPIVEAKEVVVPRGTEIKVAPKRTATSKNISRKYEIKAIIKDNVDIGGVTVFNVGDDAIIEVGEYQKARGFGRGGKLTLIGCRVTDASGKQYLTALDQEIIAPNDHWVFRIIPFNKGDQAKVTPGDVFVVKTNKAFKFDSEAVFVDSVPNKKGNRVHAAQNVNNNIVQVGIVNQK